MKSVFLLKYTGLILILSAILPNTLNAEYQWELIGPGDADQVTSIAVLNNGDIFVGFDIGGLYKSTNKGESWAAINNGLNNLDVTTKVIQSPEDASVLFVGTRGGLYKSADYGARWKRVANGLPAAEKYTLSGSIGSILIDPFDSDTVYVAMGYRPSSNGTTTVRRMAWEEYIYRSLDGGANWKTMKAFPVRSKVTQLVHSSISKRTLFASTNTGLYRSTDRGVSWEKILDNKTITIVIDPKTPDVMYAACDEKGIFKTANGGKHWREINDGISFFDIRAKFKNRYSIIAMDPANSDVLYALNSTWGRAGGIYKSHDAGGSWTNIGKRLPESWLKTSRRINDIAISHINTDNVYAGSSRYIYSSDDAGKSWKQKISRRVAGGWAHRGLNIFGQTRDIHVDRTNTHTIYVATADHKMVQSDDAGKSWQLQFGGDKNASNVWDIEQCIKAPYSLHLITSGNDKNICHYKKSNDKWRKACGRFGMSNRYEKIVLSPFDCNLVFVVTQESLFRSVNGGQSWEAVPLPPDDMELFSLMWDPNNRGAVYLGTDKGLLTSTNDGAQWRQMESTAELVVTSILSVPTDNRLYIGTQQSAKGPGAIYHSDDNGLNWEKTLDNIVKYVTAITAHPDDNNILFASTMDHNYHDLSKGSGIYMSYDKGESWHRIDDSLPVHRGYNISISDSDRDHVYFSSAGSGAYRLKIDLADLTGKRL